VFGWITIAARVTPAEIGKGVFVVTGRDAAPVFESVEALADGSTGWITAHNAPPKTSPRIIGMIFSEQAEYLSDTP
jgi:hypothetical protein